MTKKRKQRFLRGQAGAAAPGPGVPGELGEW